MEEITRILSPAIDSKFRCPAVLPLLLLLQ